MTTGTYHNIPHMNDPKVFESLEYFASRHQGRGTVVECGSWLGASAVALCKGLATTSYFPEQTLVCYDKWEANADEVRKAKEAGVDLAVGQDIRPLFVSNVMRECPQAILETYKGKIDLAVWDSEPVEILVLDAAKRNPSFRHVIKMFRDSFIPNVTVLCLLDYYFYQSVMDVARRQQFEIQHAWARDNIHALEALDEQQAGSARFFLVTGKLELP